MAAPMFKVFTGAMEPYTKSVDNVERKFIKTTASSTVTDSKNHSFEPGALQKMAKAAMGKTIFLNHEYRVPEDLFGTVTETDAKHTGYDGDKNAIWDLDLDVMVNEANPRAVQAWEAYQQGVRMGVSVGVIVKEWDAPRDKKSGGPLKIKDVDFLEASIVGIPANPRTWVQGAIKSLTDFLKAQDEGLFETLDLLSQVESHAKDEEVSDEDKTEKIEKTAEDVHNSSTDEDKSKKDAKTPPLDAENEDSLSPEEVAKSASIEADEDKSQTDTAKEVQNSTDPEVSANGATQNASDEESATLSVDSAVAGIDLLINAYKAELQEKDEQIALITKERDEALADSKVALAIVEQISKLPLGRKASFKHQISTFRRDLSGVYDADFLAFLERNPE